MPSVQHPTDCFRAGRNRRAQSSVTYFVQKVSYGGHKLYRLHEQLTAGPTDPPRRKDAHHKQLFEAEAQGEII